MGEQLRRRRRRSGIAARRCGGGGGVRYPQSFCTILFYAWIVHVAPNHGAYLTLYGGIISFPRCVPYKFLSSQG